MCLLKENVSIEWRCLLIENVPIEWNGAYQKVYIKMSLPFILDILKGAYKSKMCLLAENVSI